ncbi:hypothetical protein OAI26_03020 [Sulfitobacter sp.]|nr:hypothetical protein [Sulfitobacter sp.]
MEKIEPAPFTLQNEEGKALIDLSSGIFRQGPITALDKAHRVLEKS